MFGFFANVVLAAGHEPRPSARETAGVKNSSAGAPVAVGDPSSVSAADALVKDGAVIGITDVTGSRADRMRNGRGSGRQRSGPSGGGGQSSQSLLSKSSHYYLANLVVMMLLTVVGTQIIGVVPVAAVVVIGAAVLVVVGGVAVVVVVVVVVVV